MGKQQQKRHFIIQRPALEAEQLRQQLTKALDILGAYFTEVRHLQNELTSQLSSSELNIGWWQARYTQEHRRLARASARVESLRATYNSFLEDFRQLRQDNRNFRNHVVPEHIRSLEGEIGHLRQNYDHLLEQLQKHSREYNFSYNLRFHY